MGHKGIADVSAGTGFVVDDDLLTTDLGELFSDDPRVDICRPACSKRHNHMNDSVFARAERITPGATADTAANAIA